MIHKCTQIGYRVVQNKRGHSAFFEYLLPNNFYASGEDSPDDATVCNKVTEPGVSRIDTFSMHCRHDVCKNRISGICVDIGENEEWPRFFGPPCRPIVSSLHCVVCWLLS